MAFAIYIHGGGNVELYDRLIERLGALDADHQPAGLLDVGPADVRPQFLRRRCHF